MSKTSDEIISKNLERLVDVSQENGDCKDLLHKMANDNECAVLAFIAPYAAVRISPVEIRSASIGLSEEFAIISAIEKIRSNSEVNKLYILVNSPGGIIPSSYKIAKVLRTSFTEIKAFVPHMAASGGTLMVLAANEVVMGPMSHLTPIDVQVSYNGQYVSAYSMSRALSRLTQFFAKMTVEESPYPWRAMTDKLDPVLLEDWSSNLLAINQYAMELLTMAGYKREETNQILDKLVFPLEPHTFVIDRDRARRIGIKISNDTQDQNKMTLMKAWLTGYMLTESQRHIIRYVIPDHANKSKSGGKDETQKRPRAKNST